MVMTPTLTASSTYWVAGASKKTGCVSNTRTSVVMFVKPDSVMVPASGKPVQ